jgi:glutathione synthase/RimK-type ligase-like ATP-grasp enzyme
MTLYFMLAFHRAPIEQRPVLSQLFKLLKQRGFQVELGFGEEMLTLTNDITIEKDLYILKSHSAFWMSIAGILHNKGAHILNPYPNSLATINKIVMTEQLRAAGIPTPRSWITGDLAYLESLLEKMPLIIKPYNGNRGNGISIIRNAKELDKISPPNTLMLAQEYIEGGLDYLKTYVIGEKVWCVHKHFDLHKNNYYSRTHGQPFEVCDEICQIALGCGKELGLQLYGLDIVEDPNPKVVDLNYFPSYRDVPNASHHLADYIESYVNQNCSG